MQVVEYTRYGSPEVLTLKDVPKPVPEDDEVLIKIHSTTVSATECTFRQGKPYFSRLFTGITRPKITTLGEELSGVVEATGKNVARFEINDEVFGSAGAGFGAYAEYICLPEDSAIEKKSPQTGFDEAACVDGFLTALPFLRDTGKIQNGDKVLINGASGSVGTAAVQIAKYYNADVTGVCSASNIELVKSLGADKVIDYAREDFTESGEKYNIIFDTVGKISFSKSKKMLKDGGVFLEVVIGLSIIPSVLWTSVFSSRKCRIAATGLRPADEKRKDLIFLRKLSDDGKFRAIIDKKYALEEVSEAHRYVDKGHKKGNVVLTVYRTQ